MVAADVVRLRRCETTRSHDDVVRLNAHTRSWMQAAALSLKGPDTQMNILDFVQKFASGQLTPMQNPKQVRAHTTTQTQAHIRVCTQSTPLPSLIRAHCGWAWAVVDTLVPFVEVWSY